MIKIKGINMIQYVFPNKGESLSGMQTETYLK